MHSLKGLRPSTWREQADEGDTRRGLGPGVLHAERHALHVALPQRVCDAVRRRDQRAVLPPRLRQTAYLSICRRQHPLKKTMSAMQLLMSNAQSCNPASPQWYHWTLQSRHTQAITAQLVSKRPQEPLAPGLHPAQVQSKVRGLLRRPTRGAPARCTCARTWTGAPRRRARARARAPPRRTRRARPRPRALGRLRVPKP